MGRHDGVAESGDEPFRPIDEDRSRRLLGRHVRRIGAVALEVATRSPHIGVVPRCERGEHEHRAALGRARWISDRVVGDDHADIREPALEQRLVLGLEVVADHVEVLVAIPSLGGEVTGDTQMDDEARQGRSLRRDLRRPRRIDRAGWQQVHGCRRTGIRDDSPRPHLESTPRPDDHTVTVRFDRLHLVAQVDLTTVLDDRIGDGPRHRARATRRVPGPGGVIRQDREGELPGRYLRWRQAEVSPQGRDECFRLR